MNDDHDLIDTTEMYLRTVLELEEEKLVPLRARIAERLQQSVPTVSETVARMQRAGLLMVAADRSVQLTAAGRQDAVRVMRKHRIAECMLVDVLGLEWQLVHAEACRFEHVMSEAVERRVLDLLGHPTVSPYGNPIPGLAELGQADGGRSPAAVPLSTVPDGVDSVVIRRIAEPIQADMVLLTRLRRAGFWPGAIVAVSRADGQLKIGSGGGVEIGDGTAAHIFVTPSRRGPSRAAS